MEISNELVLPFYLLHQTVIVVVAFYVVGLNLSVIEKYLIIVLASLTVIGVLLFPIGQINVLRFLFGMRLNRDKRQVNNQDKRRRRVMADHAIVTEQTIKNRTTVRICLLAIVLILVFSGAFVFFGLVPGWLHQRDVSVRELHEHPSLYLGQKVKTVGYLVKHTAPHFGDIYTLCEGDPRNPVLSYNPCIAVAGASSIVDLYVSLFYNGTDYEVALSPCSFAVPCRVVVSGVFVYRGPVTDASQYVIEASSVAWHE